jgi:SOS-response transcriptional repressor LexA
MIYFYCMFNKTLSLYRQRAGIKKVDLARKVDVSLTYIANLESGRQKPPTQETCARIAEALCLNDEESKELQELAVFERLKSSDLATIKDRLTPGKTAAKLTPLEKPNSVPLLPWDQANKKITDDDIPIGLENISLQAPAAENTFALEIKDTSMAPEFQSGDIVIIRECSVAIDGAFVLAADHKGKEPLLRQFKNYGKVQVLHPLDPSLKDIILEEKRYTIIGKVAERLSRIKKY